MAGFVTLVSLAVPAACGGSPDSSAGSDTITLYTCVSDTTIQPVIEAFEKADPGTRSSSSAPRPGS